MVNKVTVGDLLGDLLEEEFFKFDLTEVQGILTKLAVEDPIDLSHAEMLQQQCLRAADILSEYIGKVVKTVGYLEARVNSVKNKVSLEYTAPDGSRTTTDMKIWAGNASPEAEAIQIKLANAKASKAVLEKKYDIIIKSHHSYKDIATGLRKTILGYGQNNTD